MRVGADADSVEVTVEIDQLTHRVRATAVGAAAMHAKDPDGAITESEARAIAARSMGVAPAALDLAGETSGLRVYQSTGERLGAVRAVDREGAIRVQRSHALDPRVQPCNGGRHRRGGMEPDLTQRRWSRHRAGPVPAARPPRRRSVGRGDPRAGQGAGGERIGRPRAQCPDRPRRHTCFERDVRGPPTARARCPSRDSRASSRAGSWAGTAARCGAARTPSAGRATASAACRRAPACRRPCSDCRARRPPRRCPTASGRRASAGSGGRRSGRPWRRSTGSMKRSRRNTLKRVKAG